MLQGGRGPRRGTTELIEEEKDKHVTLELPASNPQRLEWRVILVLRGQGTGRRVFGRGEASAGPATISAVLILEEMFQKVSDVVVPVSTVTANSYTLSMKNHQGLQTDCG